MIRPVTCVCMLLAVGSGLYLYQTKHRSQMLDREIVHTLKQTEAVRDRIGVLRGEWALLNEPERLADLSRQHLGLKTLSPSQFVSMADLGSRLPPPGSLVPPAAEDPANETVASEPAVAASKPATPTHVAVATPPKPASAPLLHAAFRPKPSAPIAAETAPAPHAAAPVLTASAVPPSPRHAAHSVIGGSDHRTLPAPEPKAAVLQASAYAAPAPIVASALGGSYRALPPPVPFGANQTANSGATPGRR